MDKKPMLYAISTCPRCIRLRKFLDEVGFQYDVIEVDLISREERQAIVDRLRQVHPVVSFPVIETDNVLLVGTNPDEVRKVFGV